MVQTSSVFSYADAEVSKIQELMYELRVGEIMTRPVLTVKPSSAMSEAKELMRSRRVSGLPVADQERLVGVVSVEDVIRWLENGAGDAMVSTWMTTKVVTVHSNEPAVQAINKFRTFHVGRLPVLDRHDQLIGIVTPGDVVERVLRVLDDLYREAEPRMRHERSVCEELMSDRTTVVLRFVVPSLDFDHTGVAATRIKRLLDTLHVDPQIVRRAGIAAYEAEMNLTIHATSGGQIIARVEPHQIEIEAVDEGPGISSLDEAMTPGYSTAPDWIRELGFGAGMGLNNIRTCADGFRIESEIGKGTRVLMSFHLAASK